MRGIRYDGRLVTGYHDRWNRVVWTPSQRPIVVHFLWRGKWRERHFAYKSRAFDLVWELGRYGMVRYVDDVHFPAARPLRT